MTQVKTIIDQLWQALPYRNELLMSSAMVLAVGLSYWGYTSYRISIEQEAHKTFISCLKAFETPIGPKKANELNIFDTDTLEFATHDEKWQKVAGMFNDAASKHSSSGLAPMFRAFESEALLNLGKKEEALSVLHNSVKTMSSPSLKSVYEIKEALLQIDFNDASVKEQGLSSLRLIAADAQHLAHDRALYELGQYYWVGKKFDEAKNYWNQLVLKYGKGSTHPSAWAAQAQSQLKLIS